jgi:hypothetical protein
MRSLDITLQHPCTLRLCVKNTTVIYYTTDRVNGCIRCCCTCYNFDFFNGLVPTVGNVFIFLHVFSAIALISTAAVFLVDHAVCAVNGVKGLMGAPIDTLPPMLSCKIDLVLIDAMTSLDCGISVPLVLFVVLFDCVLHGVLLLASLDLVLLLLICCFFSYFFLAAPVLLL